LTAERDGDISRSLREASSRFVGRPARIRVAGAHLLEPFVVDGAFGASELHLEAASDDATLCVAGGGGVLLHVGEGAPPITLCVTPVRSNAEGAKRMWIDAKARDAALVARGELSRADPRACDVDCSSSNCS
jgi:hypothetical protein